MGHAIEHALSLPKRSSALVLAHGNRVWGVDEVTNARMIASIREEAKTIVGGAPILGAAA